MGKNLPNNWVETTLGEIAEWSSLFAFRFTIS